MSTKPNYAPLCALLIIISLIAPLTAATPTSKSPTTKLPQTIVTLQEQPPLSGYPLQYTSFAGATYNLTAFDGLYCRYALPTTWTQPGALTTTRLRQLIDLTDLTYAQLAEITAGEPQGPGLLTIAVIPTGNMAGHAGTNFKGVELSENELGSIMQNLNSDLLSPECQHEIIHNFELWTQQINLGYPDAVHAWTSFMLPFLQSYSRAGLMQSDADALLQKKITEYTLAWDTTNATWSQCIRNGNACPNIQANGAWAGFLLRYTKLHGASAIKRAFRFIRDYAATHPSTGTNPTGPQTREEKNDLLVEALADGAQQNILCELDTWHWFATPDARARITQRFPNNNSLCADYDSDGFSPLTGDTDDTTSLIKPTAIERLNNVDDDCDLLVDDILLTENSDFPSTTQSAPTITIPTRVRGQVTASDSDTFIINHTDALPRRLRVNLQSPNTFVGFIQLQPVDLNGRTESFSVAGGGAQTLTLSRPGLWALTVQNSTTSISDYTLTIENAGPRLSPIRLKALPGTTTGTVQLTANIDQTQTFSSTPNKIRFWIGSTGFTQPTQLQTEISFTLQIPPGSGPFSLRAQLLKDETPVSKPTLALWVDRATGAMMEQNPDLIITADTLLPAETQSGNTALYGFTILNNGPGLAQNVHAQITIPSGLIPVSSAATIGAAQITGQNFQLNINGLSPDDSTSFSLTTINVNAQGNITTTALVTSTTTDPVQSNNTASITGHFTAPTPTPTPTPIPTPTPTPQPSPSPSPLPDSTLTIQSLPAKLPTASTRSILSQGSLGRVTIPLPNTALPDCYGQPNQNGLWPTSLAGFQVKIGNSFTSMVAVKRLPESTPTTYTIDFLIPDNATTGSNVAITVTHSDSISVWNSTATIQATAPAFWSIDGTANGSLLVLDADRLNNIDPLVPLVPDNTKRFLLFASGIKTLINQNSLAIQITCQSGYQAFLIQDFATSIPSLPAVQQITLRIPTEFAGCGRARLTLNNGQDNEVFLLIQ